ncbi:MAG: DUF4465 domain-containing protein [Pseudomonadota bacterium]
MSYRIANLKTILSFFIFILVMSITLNTALAADATFEDLSPMRSYVGPGGGFFENGQNMTVVSSEPSIFGGTDYNNSFSSGGFTFANTWNDPGDFWSGFAYSNTTDITTSGFTNQYSAYPGGGQGGSHNYGIVFDGADRIELESVQTVLGGYFTNTTYAALSMLNGDTFAKKFGGSTGDDEDWFLLTINGEDATGAETGSVEFYLADYRFADNSLDYLIDEWTYVSLASLGEVSALTFDFSSSDTGQFGINTPAYFAIDNISAVPLPASAWLLVSALIGLATIARRKISV